MDVEVLSESVRRALYRVIALTDSFAQPDETMRQLQERYKKRKQTASKIQIAKDLGLKPHQIDEFTKFLKEAVASDKTFEGNPVARSIALLRLLFWLEIALKAKDGVAPHLLPTAQPEIEAKKRIRAVELILRALINERHPKQDELIQHITSILKDVDIADWLKKAEPGDLLSGTLLSEVARIFLHDEEWKAFGNFYVSAAGLAYLNDKRKTIATFLHDINFMRNNVAHYKPLTDGQIELLDIYYAELVTPIQNLFRAGRTKVDPQTIIDVDSTVLERYFSTLQKELSVLDQRTEQVNSKVSVILASLLIAGSAIAYGVLSARSAIRHDYRSLGWVTLSGDRLDDRSPINVQAFFWMGSEQSHFGDATLVAVAQQPDRTSVTVDLTKKLDPDQVGSQEAVEFSLPPSTNRLVTCLSVPSASLSARFRVTQWFTVSKKSMTISFKASKANVVAKEDGSSCGSK